MILWNAGTQSNNSLDTLFGSLWASFTVLGPRHCMASYATAPLWKKLPLFLRDLGSHLRVVHGNFYWSHPTPYLKWHVSHLSRDQQTDVPQNIGSLIMGWFCIFAPKVSPRGRRDPRLWQFRLAADLRPSADGSAHPWWQRCRQQCAYSLGSCALGQTDGSRYRLIPPPYDGGILIDWFWIPVRPFTRSFENWSWVQFVCCERALIAFTTWSTPWQQNVTDQTRRRL